MRRTVFAALVISAFAGLFAADPAKAGPNGYYEVSGVDEDDMLKMRAGPGIGFRVILGLPNGTLLRIYSCEQTGGTRWCKVSLKQSRAVKGYVSWAYVREK